MNRLDQILTLQYEQLRHDQLAHADILCLPTKQKITHMTLHFAKYVGALAHTNEESRFQRVLIDALIITLASANTLNIDLAASLKAAKNISSIEDLKAIADKKEKPELWSFAFLNMAIAAGVMAKACESLDHVEKGDYRSILEQQVIEIAATILAVICILNIDFATDIRNRWAAIEKKIILKPSRIEDNDDKKPRVSLVKMSY